MYYFDIFLTEKNNIKMNQIVKYCKKIINFNQDKYSKYFLTINHLVSGTYTSHDSLLFIVLCKVFKLF